jgi:hypothetical protein
MTTGVSERGLPRVPRRKEVDGSRGLPALRVQSLEGLLFEVRKVNPNQTFCGGDRSTVQNLWR